MNVPKLRFKEFTDEWKNIKLQKIISIYKEQSTIENQYPMLTSSKQGLVLQKDYYSNNARITNRSNIGYNVLPYGYITYRNRSDTGFFTFNINLKLKKGLISYFYPVFSLKNSNKYFLVNLLNTKYQFKMYAISEGTSQKVLSIANLKNLKVLYPSLEEQNKIANFLTTVDKKITNLENTITSLENQKKGLLQQIFSQKLRFKDKNGNNYPNWEKKKLGDIATLKNGISKSNEAFGHGKKFINLQDIFNKSYIFNDNYSLVDVTEKELSENNLLKGDVLFVRSSVKREGVGLPCVIMENLIDTVYSGFIIRCRFNINENIYLHYKKYCFLEFSFRKALLKKSSSSANTNINQDNLSKLYVKLPCLEEQTKIADFLSAFDRKLENQKAQLEHWKQIKKGLLQQMFV